MGSQMAVGVSGNMGGNNAIRGNSSLLCHDDREGQSVYRTLRQLCGEVLAPAAITPLQVVVYPLESTRIFC